MKCPYCTVTCVEPGSKEYIISLGKSIINFANPIGFVDGLYYGVNGFVQGVINDKYFIYTEDVRFCPNCKHFFSKCHCGGILNFGKKLPKVGKNYKCPKCGEPNVLPAF